jgi:hypothetical protein
MKPSGLRRLHIYEYPLSELSLANQFRESPCALEILYYLRKMLTLRPRSLVVATCILYGVTLSPIGSAQQTPQKKSQQ